MRGGQAGQPVQVIVGVGRERAVGLRQGVAVAVAVVGVGVGAAQRILDAAESRDLVEGRVADQCQRGQDGRELRAIASGVVAEF